MRKILKNFSHQAGSHCASTALADMMRYHGHNLSEAMCFGTGSALWFWYLKNKEHSPSRTFYLRPMALETVCFKNLGLPFIWRESNDFPWSAMKSCIDQDIPALILTDLYYLKYYRASNHFSGHTVILAGYDTEKNTAILADNQWDELQETSLTSLATAMRSDKQPININNTWREFSSISLPPLKEPVVRALRHNCLAMLQSPSPFIGIRGMFTFSKDIVNWLKEAGDWQQCARSGYYMIEKRGTGGGGFRLLYSKFLREAEDILRPLKNLQCPDRMRAIAQTWSELGELLKEISSGNGRFFNRAGIIAAQLAREEERLFKDILFRLETE